MAQAPRAAWKGHLKLGSISCGIKLIGASTEAEKIHFKILNRKTKEPVKSAYVDETTGKIVDSEDQVKGYEVDGGFLQIEPEDIKKLKPTSEHTLEIDSFVPAKEIDQRYLDKSYYVVPADGAAVETFAVIREAMKTSATAARSCIVLYQRGREVVLEPFEAGMLMTTLRTHAEMVSEKSAFDGLTEPKKIDAEMLEIAGLLIDKKAGKFEPANFEDSYEDALIAMIKAKKAGKKPPKAAPAPKENVVNLADVLRRSLAKEGIKRSAKGKASKRKAA